MSVEIQTISRKPRIYISREPRIHFEKSEMYSPSEYGEDARPSDPATTVCVIVSNRPPPPYPLFRVLPHAVQKPSLTVSTPSPAPVGGDSGTGAGTSAPSVSSRCIDLGSTTENSGSYSDSPFETPAPTAEAVTFAPISSDGGNRSVEDGTPAPSTAVPSTSAGTLAPTLGKKWSRV